MLRRSVWGPEEMEANSLIALSLMLAVATPMTAQAQGQPGSPQNTAAPLKELQRKFGFEPDQVTAAAKKLLIRR